MPDFFKIVNVYLFDLILYVSSTIFQLCRDGSSWIEPVLTKLGLMFLVQGYNTVMPVRLKLLPFGLESSTLPLIEPICAPNS